MYNRRQYGNIFEPFHILECSKPLLFTFRKKGLWNQVFDICGFNKKEFEKKVKFASADEAKEFVSIASGCDFDVNVFYNRMIIDAKSLLGVLSLDLTKILTVEFDGENIPFEEFLERKNAMHAVA